MMSAKILCTTRRRPLSKGFPMSSKLPVTALIPALLAAASVGTITGKVLDDGKVDFKDFGTIVGGLGELAGIVDVKLGAAAAEALNLDEGEKAQVLAAFKAKFDLPSEVSEAAVELLVDGALTILVGAAKSWAAAQILFPTPAV